MIEKLSKTRRNVALAVIAVLVIWFSWTVRTVLNPVVLGYIFASTLHPAVQKLENRGWSRRAAVNLIFAGFSVALVSVGLGLYVQGRMLVRDVVDANVNLADHVENSFDAFVEEHEGWFETLLADEDLLPGADEGVEETTVGAPGDATGDAAGDAAGDAVGDATGDATGDTVGDAVGDATGDPTVDATVDASGAAAGTAAGDASTAGDATPEEPHYLGEMLREGWQALSAEQAGAGQMALRGAGSAWKLMQDFFGSVLGFLSLVLLLPLYTWFLLFELESIRGFVRRYLPVRERQRVSHVASQIGGVLANFFRGRLLICFIKGVVLTVGLWIVGIPYALLLGMGSGFLSLIPFVGPLLGFLAAFSIGLLPVDSGFLGTLIRAGLVFGAAEVIEGYVLVPKILGNSLGLHPVVVLVSVFAGGAALGMFGLLIAIPLMASLVIVTREFVLPALAQFADEDGDGLADGSSPDEPPPDAPPEDGPPPEEPGEALTTA